MTYSLKYAKPVQEVLAWDNASDEALLLSESEPLTTSVAVPFTLTSRDLDIIYSVGVYKYLSIFQLQKLHFPNAKYYRTATNRIGYSHLRRSALPHLLPSETNRHDWPPCFHSLRHLRKPRDPCNASLP